MRVASRALEKECAGVVDGVETVWCLRVFAATTEATTDSVCDTWRVTVDGNVSGMGCRSIFGKELRGC